MCGFEICNTVKRKLGMKDTTIIIISARAQVHDIKRGNDVGVDYYVTKPFDPDMILKMVTDVLSIR
jgi:DNA-binding response OmpR family regulator